MRKGSKGAEKNTVVIFLVFSLLLLLIAMTGWCLYDKKIESQGEIVATSDGFIAPKGSSASEALSMALSGEYGFEETEALYINAMNTNPDCLEAYNSYWSWVEEKCYDTVRVSFFLDVIEAAMYKCSPENVPYFSTLYKEVSESLLILTSKEKKASVSALPSESVDEAYAASDLEAFQVAFTEYLEAAGELEEEPASVREFIQKYENAYTSASRYKLIAEQDKFIWALSDSVFLSSYPSAFAELLSNLLEISSVKEDDPLGEKAFVEAEAIARAWENRYNSIIVNKVREDYFAVRKGSRSSKDKYNELSIIYSTGLIPLYSLNNTDDKLREEINNLEQWISSAMLNFQKKMYQDYQVGAAELVNTINDNINSIEKGGKLEYLYEIGYFNINQDLLFPELKDVYSDVFKESYENIAPFLKLTFRLSILLSIWAWVIYETTVWVSYHIPDCHSSFLCQCGSPGAA